MDGAAFAAMRPGAMVVAFVGDVGIDEGAAYEALRSGHLGGMAVHQWWEQWRWRPPHGYGRSPTAGTPATLFPPVASGELRPISLDTPPPLPPVFGCIYVNEQSSNASGRTANPTAQGWPGWVVESLDCS